MPRKKLLKSFKTFNQANNFLLKLDKKSTVKYSIENIKAFLNYLNNPQNNFKAVHIAGTSGKGSTAQMIANILKNTGHKTGLTISPYLIDPLERIQINNKKITQKNFVNLVNKYKKVILKFKLTYFESFIALAFIYFAKNKVDYTVVETGLGGRYDATNVFNNPALSIITNIGLDHTDILGKTKIKIAKEKQAIIKNKNAITGSKLIKNAKVINTKKYKIINYSNTVNSIITNNYFIYKKNKYKLNLLGEFQIENAILVIEACRFLKIKNKYITKGLETVKHFGRFTIISKKPLIIIDGAHNPEKMKAFIFSLKKMINLKNYKNKYLLTAIKKDKDYKKILKIITPLFNEVVITKFEKSLKPEILKKAIKDRKIRINNNPKIAFKKIKKQLKKQDVFVITGSLYLLGEIF